MDYDAIVIGAGHNGLTLAAYLQRAGMSTLVAEAARTIGGMTRTDEPALAGFLHSPHANLLSYLSMMPPYRDFRLGDRGLRTVKPVAQWGLAFSDGRPPLVLHRPDRGIRAENSVAVYSASDADKIRHLRERVQGLGELIQEGMYRPPSTSWTDTFLEVTNRIVSEVRPGAPIATFTPKQAIDTLFESDELRLSLYQAAIEYGPGLDQPAGALPFVGLTLFTLANWQLPLSGMRALPDALASACRALGVTIAPASRVEGIVVERGRAAGVRIDGEVVRARKIVASSAPLRHTLVELLGTEHLSTATLTRLRAYEATRTPVTGSLMFCLRSAPNYGLHRGRSTDINRCLRVVFGHDHAESLARDHRAVAAGNLALPAAAVTVVSLWDSSQAPNRFHVASVNSTLPDGLDASLLSEVRRSYPTALLQRWHDFADNMGDDNALGYHFGPIERRDDSVSLLLGTDQYRTEIEGLYLCGTSTHPGGGVHGACGYNAFQAIAEDRLPRQFGRPSHFHPTDNTVEF